ncbi:MAG: N-acetyltransferase, partial [Deltaproteobacteria bacterium]
YYREQFRIYRDPYLLWEKEIWKTVVATCEVFRVEVDGRYAGDVVLEDRGKGGRYIVDFSILPEWQRKGVGEAVMEQLKKKGGRLTAVTRKETLSFFLRSGFVLKRTMKNYYSAGVDGYSIECAHPPHLD